MDLGGGWDLAPEQQCQLHVLDWLYDRVGGRADQAVDVDPAVVGEEIRGIRVRHMDEIASLRAAERPDIGVITTPGWAAQGVADLLVRAGVTSLLNFAPRVLTVPPTVHLRYVDLSIELQVLGFYRVRAEESGGDGVHAPMMRSVGLSQGPELT